MAGVIAVGDQTGRRVIAVRSLAQIAPMNDPIQTLEEILRRNGHDLNLRDPDNEQNRYFLFDQISAPSDLDLAWSQFPAHRQIRARAAEVDALSDIVTGWGYRIPKPSNRCSDADLARFVHDNLAATRRFMSGNWDDVGAFIDNGYDIQLVSSETSMAPDPVENVLFMALYESMCDFKIDRFPFEQAILEILYDWAICLTKCDEVALYLFWPVLKDVEAIDPNTPVPAFRLWQYNCRTNYWIKDGDLNSRAVCLQRPWAP